MNENIEAALNEGLDPEIVCKNPKGMSYIPGWRVIGRLNAIFGWDGWTTEIVSLDVQTYPFKERHAAFAICRMRLTLCESGKTIEDVGYGDGKMVDFGSNHEGAVKEAATDALKRCAKSLGPAFGLSLYDKDNPVHQGGRDWWGQGPAQAGNPPDLPADHLEAPDVPTTKGVELAGGRFRNLWFARLAALAPTLAAANPRLGISRNGERWVIPDDARHWIQQRLFGHASLAEMDEPALTEHHQRLGATDDATLVRILADTAGGR